MPKWLASLGMLAWLGSTQVDRHLKISLFYSLLDHGLVRTSRYPLIKQFLRFRSIHRDEADGSDSGRMLLHIQDTALANEEPKIVGIGIAVVSKAEHLKYDEAKGMSARRQVFDTGDAQLGSVCAISNIQY